MRRDDMFVYDYDFDYDFVVLTILLLKGDSGSPLTVDGTLAGIVSAGGRQLGPQVSLAYTPSPFQNGTVIYDLYTDVSKHIGWLNYTILAHGGLSSCGYTLATLPSNGEASIHLYIPPRVCRLASWWQRRE